MTNIAMNLEETVVFDKTKDDNGLLKSKKIESIVCNGYFNKSKELDKIGFLFIPPIDWESKFKRCKFFVKGSSKDGKNKFEYLPLCIQMISMVNSRINQDKYGRLNIMVVVPENCRKGLEKLFNHCFQMIKEILSHQTDGNDLNSERMSLLDENKHSALYRKEDSDELVLTISLETKSLFNIPSVNGEIFTRGSFEEYIRSIDYVSLFLKLEPIVWYEEQPNGERVYHCSLKARLQGVQ